MERPEYLTRLRIVKEILPKQYGVILRYKHPELITTTVYNVVDKEAYNESVLLGLEDTFLNKKSIL